MLQKTSFAYKAIAVVLISLPFHLFSINYTINFTGSGASTTLDNVIVENITKGTITSVPAGNSLYLTNVATTVESINSNTSSISVFPNPIIDKSTVSFQAKSTGNATIKVFSLEGKNLISAKSQFGTGNNSFQLSLPKGTYLIQISGNDYTCKAKTISQSNTISKASISFATNENTIKNKPQKVKSGLTTMLYTDGDQLLYRGKSGNYTAIVTDRPTSSKTTNFDFVECKDADGNYYTTVKIGSQIWMAENLKTTKYRNNDAIPKVTNNSEWIKLNPSIYPDTKADAYCTYDNDPNFNDMVYGKLYNWYAITNPTKISPVGWLIPTEIDWLCMISFLGGYENAGVKLKSTSDVLWKTPKPISSNESGFSALPGGYRYSGGTFESINTYGTWWSSSIFDANIPTSYSLAIYAKKIFTAVDLCNKSLGLSVRCIKDIANTITPFDIKETTATSGGNITYDGDLPITERGVCWNTSANPTISNNKTIDGNGNGNGAFSSNLTELSPNTTYFVRAYFTNSFGTFYGEQYIFTTTTLEISQSYQGGKIISDVRRLLI